MGKTKPSSHPAVFAKELTANAKLGSVSATYVAQQSCPRSCPFLNAGCYAENGFTGGFITKRLNRRVPADITPDEIATQEALGIDGLSGQNDLRLHVVGDSITIEGTKRIAEAARRFIARGARKVWSYTHAWRVVPRSAWGRVSILASCETEQEVLAARARGYATAMTVERHESEKLERRGAVNLLPCPQQTRGVPCSNCRLCLDDRRLFDANITIAFAIHGGNVSKPKALKALQRQRLDEDAA